MRAQLEMCQTESEDEHHIGGNSLERLIGRELDFLRATGHRGKTLQALHEALRSIQPTSVEAERAFSSAGSLLTRVRSRLSDNTLSKLCMLRNFFQHSENLSHL